LRRKQEKGEADAKTRARINYFAPDVEKQTPYREKTTSMDEKGRGDKGEVAP